MRYEIWVQAFDPEWLRDHGYVDAVGMPSKESMTKLSEEAMECYSAWENMREARAQGATSEQWLRLTHKLVSELADVIQAACNIAAICGAGQQDFALAMWECEERNERRGRMGRG